MNSCVTTHLAADTTRARRWWAALAFGFISMAAGAQEPWYEAKTGELFMRTGEQPWQAGVLVRSEADVRISGMMVEVQYQQHFENTSDQWQEAVYAFPLGEQAAIHALRMRIGEREIVGEIKEKAQAKQIYQQAKREGKRATLLDQQRPNMFTQRIANIPPGETVAVTLSYSEPAQFADGLFSWRLPTTLTPRYAPPTHQASIDAIPGAGEGAVMPAQRHALRDSWPATSTASDPAHGNTIAITVRLRAGMPLAEITALYHDIAVTRDADHQYEASLRGGLASMDRDFLLQWRPVASAVPRSALFKQGVDGNDYLMLMVLPPDTEATKALPRDVIFVLDTSGSMAGASVAQAKSALARAVAQLGEGDRFNVVEFNSDYNVLFEQLQPADAATKAQAVAWVEQLQADGGTEMLPALDAALRGIISASTALKQIVFITDGAVANESALFQAIQQRLGDSRLFTVGIGAAPNSYFMRKAAQFGRGTFTYIGQADQVASAMDQLFAKLSSAAASNVELSWPAVAEQFPARVPDLYRGEPLLVFAKTTAVSGDLSISGEFLQASPDSPVQPWQQSLPLAAIAHMDDSPGIARLWARQKVESLEDAKLAGGNAAVLGADILALALTHQLVTQYTGLVAVEQQVSRPPAAEAGESKVANSVPKGQLLKASATRAIAFPATATSLSLSIYVGLLATLALGGLLGTNRSRRGTHEHA